MAQTPEQQSKDNLFVRMLKWLVETWPGRVVGGALLLVVLIAPYWLPVVGYGDYQGKPDFDRAKTLWDWFDLLGVPVVLAVGAYLFSRAERTNEQEIAAEQVKQDRARTDDTLHQTLVQDYLDRMSNLLLDKDKPLEASALEDVVRDVARARTLTVLRGLGEDGAHKGYIVQFLYETELIKDNPPIVELQGANLQKADLHNVALNEANLSGANLSGANLSGAVLSGANLSKVEIGGANLSGANLSGANLTLANLSGANLSGTVLSGAVLSGANLSKADLTLAYLSKADLTLAYLGGADLSGADLIGADLSGAGLISAKVTNEQLADTRSLEGATMIDGSEYAGVPRTTGEPTTVAQGIKANDTA